MFDRQKSVAVAILPRMVLYCGDRFVFRFPMPHCFLQVHSCIMFGHEFFLLHIRRTWVLKVKEAIRPYETRMLFWWVLIILHDKFISINPF